MVAEEERHLPAAEQGEIGFEVEGELFGAGKKPVLSGRVFGEPGEGGGEEELAARPQQRGEPMEEGGRIGNPIEEVGGEEELEGIAQGCRKGVADAKLDPFRIDIRRNGKAECGGLVALKRNRMGESSLPLEKAGGFDEGRGAVEPEDVATASGELEAGAADGAAELEGPGFGGELFPPEAFPDAADGEVGQPRRGGARQLPFRGSVVEDQVLGEGGARLVEGRAHAERSSSLRK